MSTSPMMNLPTISAAPLPSLERAARELASRNVEESLYYFTRDILGYEDLDASLHGELCEAVQERAERKLILLPRGHLKTTVCTVAYPLWRLMLEPNTRIALISSTQSNATAYLREIKGHLAGRSYLRFTYPRVAPPARSKLRWSSTEVTIRRPKLYKESSIEAAGVGGTLVGKHFDLIVFDDVVTPENASTDEQREKLFDWYRHSLSLLEPGGEALVVGTRYHYHDLYGRLAESGSYKTLLRRAVEEGRSIFPGRFPPERLAALRAEQGSYIFSCQYLNEPVDDERAAFRRSWVRFVRPDALPTGMLYFMTVDPAIGESFGSDYTAIATCGMDGEGNLYVMDLVRERLSPHGLIEELFRLYERWKPIRIGIETVGFQATIVHFLKREMLTRGVRLPVVELKRAGNQPKSLRILALQPLFEQGQIFIVEGCPHSRDLEEELLRFPRGATDDILDALADQLRIAFPPRDSESVFLAEGRGRSLRTGY